MFIYTLLAIGYVPWYKPLHQLTTAPQTGGDNLGRTLPNRKRRRRVRDWARLRSHVPHPDPPVTEDPAKVAFHWLRRVDRGRGSVRLGHPPVHHRSSCIEVWHYITAAVVSSRVPSRV